MSKCKHSLVYTLRNLPLCLGIASKSVASPKRRHFRCLGIHVKAHSCTPVVCYFCCCDNFFAWLSQVAVQHYQTPTELKLLFPQLLNFVQLKALVFPTVAHHTIHLTMQYHISNFLLKHLANQISFCNNIDQIVRNQLQEFSPPPSKFSGKILLPQCIFN